MIDFYSFGRIVVDGKEYTSDVIIYPTMLMVIGGERKATDSRHVD